MLTFGWRLRCLPGRQLGTCSWRCSWPAGFWLWAKYRWTQWSCRRCTWGLCRACTMENNRNMKKQTFAFHTLLINLFSFSDIYFSCQFSMLPFTSIILEWWDTIDVIEHLLGVSPQTACRSTSGFWALGLRWWSGSSPGCVFQCNRLHPGTAGLSPSRTDTRGRWQWWRWGNMTP